MRPAGSSGSTAACSPPPVKPAPIADVRVAHPFATSERGRTAIPAGRVGIGLRPRSFVPEACAGRTSAGGATGRVRVHGARSTRKARRTPTRGLKWPDSLLGIIGSGVGAVEAAHRVGVSMAGPYDPSVTALERAQCSVGGSSGHVESAGSRGRSASPVRAPHMNVHASPTGSAWCVGIGGNRCMFVRGSRLGCASAGGPCASARGMRAERGTERERARDARGSAGRAGERNPGPAPQ
jgi:hypothetical protein